jgi:hypothetical protein
MNMFLRIQATGTLPRISLGEEPLTALTLSACRDSCQKRPQCLYSSPLGIECCGDDKHRVYKTLVPSGNTSVNTLVSITLDLKCFCGLNVDRGALFKPVRGEIGT